LAAELCAQRTGVGAALVHEAGVLEVPVDIAALTPAAAAQMAQIHGAQMLLLIAGRAQSDSTRRQQLQEAGAAAAVRAAMAAFSTDVLLAMCDRALKALRRAGVKK
jgi:hypothetical protein